MRLPLHERVLNAYAAGFAPAWIAERFQMTTTHVETIIVKARRAGDRRAVYTAQSVRVGRWRSTMLKKQAQEMVQAGAPPLALSERDEFPELPAPNDWASLKPPRLEMDETAND
jgi:hypothetical protein